MLGLLWMVAIIFAVMWLLGLVAHVALGGFIHVLLAVALIAVIVRVILGRRLA